MQYRCEQVALGALLLLLSTSAWAEDSRPKSVPPFTGKVHLPLSLETSEGSRLEQGPFDLEVRAQRGSYSLYFVSAEGEKAVTTGQLEQSLREQDLGYPLVGTIHLRSSSDHAGTDAERHKSKTGLPQYQEEPRRWETTLRLYRPDAQDKAIWILFQQNEQPSPIRAWFQLSVADTSDKP